MAMHSRAGRQGLRARAGEFAGDAVTAYLRAGVGFLCPLIASAADVIVWVDRSGGSFEARIAREDCAEIITGSGQYVGGLADADLQATLDAVLR